MNGGDLEARLAALAPAQRALLERALERQRRRADPQPGPARRQEAATRIPRRPPGSVAPLSVDQERLWFIQQLDRLSPVYNIYGANRFYSAIEVPLLVAALNLMVARHEVLRTTFPAIDGRPVQQIAAALRVAIPVIDLRCLPDGIREAEAQRRAAAVVSAAFDLERLPLFRVQLLRVEDADYICPIAIHHIVTDWISYYAMEAELTAIYSALRAGMPPALPELPIQFADFAVWQRQRLADGSVLAEQLEYWRRHLEGAPELLPLPTDRPRQPVQTPWGARRRLSLLPAQSEATRILARREEATLFVTVLAVWKALLLRLTGQEKLIVGTPMAYRQGPDLEGVLGFFLNQLVLYSDLSGNPPFRQALRRVRDTALDAYAHQDLPFARLVEALHPERDLSRVPYTQVVFLLLNPHQLERPGADGLEVDGYWVDAHRTQFDMTFSLWDGGAAGLYGWIEYSTDLFDAATIGRMREQLRTLLAGALADPDRRVWDLPLLPEAQRHQLVAEWSGGATLTAGGTAAAGEPATVHELVAAQAAATPAAPALIAAGELLSYGELARRVDLVARALALRRLPAESVVGVCLERSPNLVAALLGVLAAGHAYLPLDPSHPADRRRFMLDDAGAAALLEDGAPHAAGLAGGSGWAACRLDVAEILAGAPGAASAGLGLAHGRPVGGAVDPDRLAYVIYTSGSTGRPKGVEVRHGALSQLLRAMRERPGITAGDRLLAVTTVAFDIAGLELFLPLISGAAVVLADRETAADGWLLLDLMAASGATLMQATPATWRLLLAAGWGEGSEKPKESGLSAWCGGEALTGELAAALVARSPRVWNLYGPTETTIWSAVERVARADSAPTASGTVALGQPIAGTRMHVVDAFLQPAPAGVSGELAIGGAGLARGYRGRPELTAERFVPDPFGGAGARLYRTGDRVRLRQPGVYEFLGRLDHQVKLRGYRIELGEIERVLESHPAIRQAAVLLREDRPGDPADQRLTAYYVPRQPDQSPHAGLPAHAPDARQPGHPPDAATLRAYLRERLPEYMLPAALVALDVLPLTANGKLDRRALARIAPAAEPSPVAGRAPAGPLEELVAGVMGEVLGLPQLAPDDDFFALGGHSLSAFQAIARLREALAVELPVPALFARPTPAGLAADLAARLDGGAPALPPLLPVAGRGPTAPLSFAQQRLWFLDRLRPGATAYNLAAAARLPESIDAAILAAAANEVVRRHEALRTTFGPARDAAFRASSALAHAAEPAEAMQRIAPAAGAPLGATGSTLRPLRLPLPRVVLAALPAARGESEMLRLAAAEVRRPFDLERGPLLRLVLIEPAAGGRVLVVTIHHIVSDAWSLSILFGELAALYAAFAAGRPSPLPPLGLQYADYAIWQRAALAGEPLAASLAYWRQQLAGAPALLELPTDRPRAAVRGEAGASRPALLPGPLAAALAAVARRQGATLFMVLLAGFSALFARLSGQDDVVVGAPIAGRPQRALEELIGFFVNTLALRTDLSGEPPFAELLRRVRAAALQAYVHSALPFEKLVEELAPARNLSRTPLFQAVLTLQNAPPPRFPDAGPHGGGRLAPVALDSWASKFDLTLELTPSAAGLAGRLEYSTELWDAPSVERFLAHWTVLLAAAAAEPSRPWRELPLLGAAERHQLVHEWNEPAPATPTAPPCLHRRFEAWARRQPQAPAVLFAGAWLSYAELNARANRLARHLRAHGVGPEAVVGLLLHPSHALVVAWLAVEKAGAAYLPLDPDAPRQRLAFQIADAGILVAVTAGADGVQALQAAAHDAGAGLAGARAAAAATLQVIDLEAAAAAIGALAAGDLPGDPDPEGLAYVIYTSGSTGQPKGTEITQRNMARLFTAARPAIGFDAADTWLLAHSYAFDFSVWELWGALAFGGRLVVAPTAARRSPEALARLMTDAGVTILNQTPSAFYQLAAYGDGAGSRPGPALRRVVFGGEALDPSRVAGWLPGPPVLINMYGITETTVHVTLRRLAAADARRGGSPLGRPLPDLAVHLLDRHLEPVPVLVPGELHVGGAGLARGYRRRPELTALRFVPNPFATAAADAGSRLYRSGDLARRRADGELEYLGRIDQQVKIRGFRIEPAEIEAALTAQAEVREAAVVAQHEPEGGARLVAYLVPAGNDPVPPADELLVRLRRTLPEYMLPAAFVVLPALPRTANGKLDRAVLPEPAAVRPELGRPYSAPSSFAEEVLAAVWARVLGLDRVGRDDNFFALGGDSIRSLQVLDLARERGIHFRLEQLFRHQTVAELARAAASSQQPENDQASSPAGSPLGETGPFSLLAAADRATLPRGIEDAYPLTQLQAGMLYYMEATPEYPLYHNVDSAEIRAPYHPAAFQEALDRSVARHPVLRTGFDLTSYTEPLQLVHATARMRLGLVDLRSVPAAAQGRALAAFVQSEKRRRFDLLRPPLLRFHLHQLGEARFQVTLTECHAILDGWSLNSILAEVFAHYLAAVHGQPPPAEPPPAAVFRDYVAQERQAMADPAQREFWRAKLAGAVATALPRRLVSRPAGGAPASIVQAAVPGDVATGLLRLAAAVAVPLKSVCLAAHLRVLQAAGGRTDVLTGLVVNGRPETAGGERVRGLFLNTLPLRLTPPRDATWADLVRATFAAECELLPFRSFPFAAVQRDWGKEPLLQVAFNYTRFHLWQAVVDRGWQVETGGGFAVELEENHFPLMVNFNYDDKLERLRLTLDTQVSAAAAEVLLGHYLGVLQAMSADPGASCEEAVPQEEWERTLGALARLDPPCEPPAGAPLTAQDDSDSDPDRDRRLPESSAAAAPRPLPLPAGVAAAPYVAPRGPVEERLAAIFAEALGSGPIGAEDSFFELGGHSLLAVRAVAKTRAAFGCALTLRDLFAAPTVAALARRIATDRAQPGRGPGAPALVAAGPPGGLAAAPLSYSQLRLWVLWQLDQGSPLFNMPLPMRLAGPLDLPALAGALAEITRRHASLRTTFPEGEDGEPVARAAPPVAAAPPLVDLSALPGAARGGEASRLVAAEALLPFDLTRGPLFRPRVYRLAAAEHLVTFTMHHIVCDGWSHEIFLREVAELYDAASAGLPSPLPELPIQYSDYAVWQRAALDEPALAGQLAYWLRQLDGAPAALELPMARPRPAVQGARGGGLRLALPRGLAAEVGQLGRRLGATPFMTLLAAFAALLSRYSGQTDLVIGAPIAGRDRGETHGLIGFFLNTLPLRCDLAGDPSFAELLGRVRATTLQAFAHQDLRVERLIEELRLPRDPSRTPLFQVVCNWQSFGARSATAATAATAATGAGGGAGGPTGAGDDTARRWPRGLALDLFPAGEPLAKFDLELYAEEVGAGFVLDLVYNRDLFTAGQAAEMERHFAALLAAVVADPARRLSEIALRRRAPRAAAAGQPVARRPAVATERFPAAALEGSLADRFLRQAAAHPRRVAVRTGAEAWTYARLSREARRVAHALLARGGPAGERIALLAPSGPWQAAAVLGILEAGKVYVPLDLHSPAERLLAIAEDAAASVVLEATAGGDAAAAGLAARGIERLAIADLPPAPAGWAAPPVPPEALAYLLYTSGTTGRPKGVMQSHRNVLAHVRAYANRLDIRPGDRLSMLPALTFDAAVMDLFGALLTGAELCPFDLRGEGVDRLGDFLLSRAVTIYHSTPTVYRAFLAGLDGERRFPAARLVVLGGEEATRRDFELFRRHFGPGCRLVNGLGPTESTLALQAIVEPGDEPQRASLPAGHPVAGTDVALVHEAGEQVATWGVGEIAIASPYVALGYWRAPGLTAAAFVPDPGGRGERRYRTGDLGRLLPDGGIEFCGRRDLQVKIRGVRVEPAEVEAVLADHPAVAQAAVVAYERNPGEPRLAAYVTLRQAAAAPPPETGLRDLLRARLPAAMVPDVVAVLDALPAGPTGKADRRALAELAARAERPAALFAAPESPTERALAAIWSELLGVERISLDDDFFDLGGHSLLIIRVRSRLEAALGIDLPLAELFTASTLRGAAAAADRARLKPASHQPLQITAVPRTAHRMRRDALDPEP